MGQLIGGAMIFPWWPVVWVDITGSAAGFALAVYCIHLSWRWARNKPEDTSRHYILLLTMAIGAFTISRSFGHLIKQLLLLAELKSVWVIISPISGAVNTATFIIIFAFSIYFDRLRNIKIEADRTAVELATARARAAAAHEAEARLRTIFDGFADSIHVIDNQQRLLFFNEKAQSSLPGIAIGQLCYEAIYQQAKPCPGCRLEAVLQGQVCSSEKEFPSLKKTMSISEIPLVWPDGQNVKLTVLRDVTENKQLEAQLLHAQKMEAVGVLAGGVAHDFNNLLTVICGQAEILQNRPGLAHCREDIGDILKAARQASTLTRQLLLFSRKQAFNPRVMDLNVLVADLRKMLIRLIGEDLDLTAELAPFPLQVKVDPGQMEQVIMNLVINARDALSGGGRIVIKCDRVILDEHYCRTTFGARPGTFVRVTVTDSGCGMTKEVMEKIFEPFFTTKGLHKGTGLGLSVVFGIIKQHGGWVNVYSETGKGTTFRVYLPASIDSAELHREAFASPPGGKGERILLVEDEEQVRKITIALLTASGYLVREAENQAKAVELFEQAKGEFDLVLSDIVLPGGNGCQLMELLQASKPGLPVLLMSGYADEKSQWPAIAEKKVPFLQKPFASADLLIAVRELLDKR
jgi:two-component system, cell cycle sensor histidine kinase and response regulator CckA